MKDQKYYYSEIFYSIQGEGHYTGVPSAWIRFLCVIYNAMVLVNKIQQIPQTYELPFWILMYQQCKK